MAVHRNIKALPLLATALFLLLGARSSLAVNYGGPNATWTEDEGFEVSTWVDPGTDCLAFGKTSWFLIEPGSTIDVELDFNACGKSLLVGLGYLATKTSALQKNFARAKFDFGIQELSTALASTNSVSTDGAIVTLPLSPTTETISGSGSTVRISVTSHERKAKKISLHFSTQ